MAASLSLTEGPHKNGKRVEIAVAEESSESETEPEPAKRFHRRISTNREIKSSVSYILEVGVCRCTRLTDAGDMVWS